MIFKILTVLRELTYLMVLFTSLAFSNISTTEILKSRLKKIKYLHVNFAQEVYNLKNEILAENRGEIWIKFPNFFNWHIKDPEESFLISDGITLWFYVPSINQVTAYWLRNFFDCFPLMLFINNCEIQWNKYNVLQVNDMFSLIPKFKCLSDIEEFKIQITDDGTIDKFSFFENNTEQRIFYKLYNHNNNYIDDSKFIFNLSEDIQLDEQRIIKR